MRSLLFGITFWFALTPAFAGQAEFLLSAPVAAPIEREKGVIGTDLRALIDAHGLALFLKDDSAAQRLGKVLKEWQQNYAALLKADPELAAIDQRVKQLFSQMLGDRSRPITLLRKMISQAPAKRLQPIVLKWIKNLFFRRGVLFPYDLAELSRSDQADICLQTRSMHTQKGMSSGRVRALAWLYRDREVRRMFHERDDRLAFLTPIRVPEEKLDGATRKVLRRYLAMVRALKLQVVKNQTMPYDQFRTLDGLLRGLRYMDTIRESSAIAGLDHRLMTRLFIQESEFIHERVSWAGAFSLAQFLNIALKDIWIFRGKIPGAKTLLRGVTSYEDLKKKVVADPRMAIKASCTYFRRIRDEAIMRLGKKGRTASREMVTLLTLEMLGLRRGVSEGANLDAQIAMGRAWPVREMYMLPLVPVAGGIMPDAGALLAGWIERTVRDLVHLQLVEGVFAGRLDRLMDAMGLAAYNAGMGNLIKSSKAKSPFGPLSFPLQLTETRNYVDDIMDGTDILRKLDRLASEISLLEYAQIIELAEDACQRAGLSKKKKSTQK